jgi:hypothetical protein
MFTLDMSPNEWNALQSALENYLNGNGMEDGDEDESVLEEMLTQLGQM